MKWKPLGKGWASVSRLVIGKFWQMIQNGHTTLTATTFHTEASAKNGAYKGHFILNVKKAMTKRSLTMVKLQQQTVQFDVNDATDGWRIAFDNTIRLFLYKNTNATKERRNSFKATIYIFRVTYPKSCAKCPQSCLSVGIDLSRRHTVDNSRWNIHWLSHWQQHISTSTTIEEQKHRIETN